jgi:hypothetical protein
MCSILVDLPLRRSTPLDHALCDKAWVEGLHSQLTITPSFPGVCRTTICVLEWCVHLEKISVAIARNNESPLCPYCLRDITVYETVLPSSSSSSFLLLLFVEWCGK